MSEHPLGDQVGWGGKCLGRLRILMCERCMDALVEKGHQSLCFCEIINKIASVNVVVTTWLARATVGGGGGGVVVITDKAQGL